MAERIPIQVKQDHLAQLANSRTPLDAVAELIWNGLDADAKKVVVSFETNALGSLDSIRITDNGHGIFYPDAKSLFGNLGESWKKTKRRTDGGRGIHGKNGKGRFKAFFIGSVASWKTTYRNPDGKLYDYTISGNFAKLDAFDISPATLAKGTQTGTELKIVSPQKEFRSLIAEEARLLVAQLFGAYLTDYPFVEIVYHDERIDPKTAQERTEQIQLEVELPGGGKIPASLRIIEWKHDTDRVLHLCDGGGVSLHSQPLGPAVKAKGFNFTAYLKADIVRDLDKESRLELAVMGLCCPMINRCTSGRCGKRDA